MVIITGGYIAEDGSILIRTIDHELHRKSDAKIVSSTGNAYRFSFNWSKLQREPFGKLKNVDEHREFLGLLKEKKMFVLHHFANPMWFAKNGAWASEESVNVFKDYAEKMANAFGDLVDSWNTINEPSAIVVEGYARGKFPPKNLYLAYKVLKNLSKAHTVAYRTIREIIEKKNWCDQPIGVSNPTMDFHPESFFGWILAKIAGTLFLKVFPDHFKEVDFVGLSYYGRVPFRPNPILEYENLGLLGKFGKRHNKMYEIYPEGLTQIIDRFYERYNKPSIITETGSCTDDDNKRILYLKDHIAAHKSKARKEDKLLGIFVWSLFDNFEFNLGLSYRFGLVEVDLKTMERRERPSAEWYRQIAKQNYIMV